MYGVEFCCIFPPRSRSFSQSTWLLATGIDGRRFPNYWLVWFPCLFAQHNAFHYISGGSLIYLLAFAFMLSTSVLNFLLTRHAWWLEACSSSNEKEVVLFHVIPVLFVSSPFPFFFFFLLSQMCVVFCCFFITFQRTLISYVPGRLSDQDFILFVLFCFSFPFFLAFIAFKFVFCFIALTMILQYL